MEEKFDDDLPFLKADMKMDRMLERLDDVGTLTEIIHFCRKDHVRSRDIAIAIIKYIKEG